MFLTILVSTLTAEFHVDPKRVFVTGFSNGASMAYRFACEQPLKVAAIAPVAGGLAAHLVTRCAATSSRPIPLLVMHGTADTVNPFDDGELEGNVQYWIRRNGCALAPEASQLPDTEPDGTRTRVENYGNCRDGADVKLYAIEGGEHRWPGGDEPFRLRSSGNIRDFDAAIVIWDFFREHPMPATE
jgi:polyhydroxybutyrate depolymerase